jgi:hypothetical protein
VQRDGVFSKLVSNGTDDDGSFVLYSSQGAQMYYPLASSRVSETVAPEFELKVLEVLCG